ncbi:plasmid pRiA4b ORF-3 family protein [Candidatus Woesearchaeota archaeon]|nr:plasmid pRiA4b ORF-3 family protein [Candidatus Woesearchaeota archaeon]
MTNILQLKIVVNEITPEIWRRFLVKDNINLNDLHNVIQVVMGWENYHLFEFSIGDEIITSDEEGFNPAEASFDKLFKSPEFQKMLEQSRVKGGSASLDIDKVNKILKNAEKNQPRNNLDMTTKLRELITTGQEFTYRYDFGDNWEHTLIVEKIKEEKDIQDSTVCLEGERACPPEDCGGVSGYYELIRIKKNKKHKLYKERIRDWLGEDFNFELFNLTRINKELKRIARRLK